jgi:DNA-directed RNA polymerase subunit RPC12/RpoP
MSRYLRSQCKSGYLCKYKILESINGGLLERCERCGKKMFFPHDTPNHKYLEYHARQALQETDKLFAREYPEHAR